MEINMLPSIIFGFTLMFFCGVGALFYLMLRDWNRDIDERIENLRRQTEKREMGEGLWKEHFI